MKGILGRKVGMTQVFTKDSKLIPVTVIQVLPNVVTQVKTLENDGYNAVQLATVEKKVNRATKAEIGHAKKANTTPKRFLKEIRNASGDYKIGDTIDASVFTAGEYVDVTGTSKGKGFAGVIKRHNQSRGPETHGSRYHRRPGSMGTMRPMRVMKGKNLSGHMGVETRTIQNLEIIEINTDENYILVSGSVPGAKNSLVLVKSAVKNLAKAEAKEIIEYEQETVVDEVIEETTNEVEQQDIQEDVESKSEENTEQQEEVLDEVAGEK